MLLCIMQSMNTLQIFYAVSNMGISQRYTHLYHQIMLSVIFLIDIFKIRVWFNVPILINFHIIVVYKILINEV